MNIVFFIQNFSRSAGSERVTSIIANFLASENHNISILSICGNNTSFYNLDERIELFTLIKTDSVNNKKEFFKVKKRLKKFYAHRHVDLVIDVFASLSIYTLLLKKRFKYRNITWEHFNYKAKIGLNSIGRKMACKKSDCIITLTNKDKVYYMKDNKKIKKIINIYNPSPYKLQNSLVNKKKKQILTVGRLTYQKGYDKLLDLWKRIYIRNVEWNLVIVGDGEEEENLKNKIAVEEIYNVEIVASTREIDRFYKESQLYVSTSRYEGLPMTMIEAQTFGLPIISYDYDTGPSDIIDESNGILIENNNIEEFVVQLHALMNDPKRILELSKNSFISSRRFECEKIFKQWKILIEEFV